MRSATLTARVLAAADGLPEGACLRIELESCSLVALRHEGVLHCYHNRCPHRGTELDWRPGAFLDPSKRWLQCSTHGALFDPGSGLCVAGPCVGERLGRFTLPAP